jgi:hypothetical protein
MIMRKDPRKKLRQVPEVELSEEGERMLDEAEADVAAGRVREYDYVAELIDDLHAATSRD